MKATLSYPISFSSVIVHRTQSTQTANAIHADGERNPCRRRTQSDWAADAIIRGYTCLKCMNPAKRNVLDLKNETCKNREKRNVLKKIAHTTL